MTKPNTYRKPRYFFTVFGGGNKPPVEGGYYPHKGYIGGLGMLPGDVMLLYCTGSYLGHFMEAPGIGVVLGTSEECIHYQYFPLEQSIDWHTIKASLKKYKNRLKVLWSKGNWLFKIDKASARDALKGREIDWP